MGTHGLYPADYEKEAELPDGEVVCLRMIRLDDETRMVKFHEGLSALTVRRRYFDSMSLASRTKHERLVKICNPQLERECAIVMLAGGEIVAVGRLEDHDAKEMAEFAVLVVDAWQARGVGRVVIEELLKLAEGKGLKGIEAELMTDNRRMRKLLKKMKFQLVDDFEEQATYAVKRFVG